MEDLESLLQPYGVTDLAAVHQMIARARQLPVVTTIRADRAVAAGATDGDAGPR